MKKIKYTKSQWTETIQLLKITYFSLLLDYKHGKILSIIVGYDQESAFKDVWKTYQKVVFNTENVWSQDILEIRNELVNFVLKTNHLTAGLENTKYSRLVSSHNNYPFEKW